ncbi:MAG: NAD(P)H-dependent oxidoreductase [Solirubrobacteraceae bacterium]|jgi:chromate reductase|nr:NAD(P)H-dependent oxidoreductase [Solirubrobacteraceae bacterium]
MRILAIAGSLRRDSHNARLLRAAAIALPPGAELELLEPDALRALPPFDADLEEPVPAAVAALRERVAAADALLISTPEYNGSVPGALKNAVDWLSRPVATTVLRGKDAAVLGGSTGMFGAVWAQADLRRILATAGARVVDRELPVPAFHEAFGEDDLPHDPDLRQALADHTRALVEAAATTRELAAAQR